MAMKQEANTPVILTVGAVSSLLVLVVVFGVEAWFRYEQREELNEQYTENPNTWLNDLRATQNTNITTYDFDREEHSWRVPVTVAMKKLIDDSAKEAAQRPKTPPQTQPAGQTPGAQTPGTEAPAKG
ncbi:MAG TPA: hypothetical protein VFC78_05805 [Tepidisphaeraceae bacterium]|nr:hypothetical protein [Tepidisphaeraceae bacterium]